jgi:hypothetical protein
MATNPPDPADAKYKPTGKDDDADKINAFITDLATAWMAEPKALGVVLWKDLKGQKASQDIVRTHLQASYDGDMKVLKSFGKKEVVAKAWMVVRVEELRYNQAQMTQANPGVWPKFTFAKPGERETEDVPAAVKGKGSKTTKIAPETAKFLTAVSGSFPKFTASNYDGHTTASAVNQGMSVDILLSEAKKTPDGFWEAAQAVKFLRAVDGVAGSDDFKGTRWVALYNDFDVADELKKAEYGKVRFRGDGVNYHGPEPLKLHIHLELYVPIKS